MRKILTAIALAFCVVTGASVSSAQVVKSKKPYAKAQMTANSTLTYLTDGYTVAQVTVTKDAGTPDGTITIYTRPSATGGAVAVATYATPSATKTFTGEAQNVLEVVLTGASTGTIGIEVVLQ